MLSSQVRDLLLSLLCKQLIIWKGEKKEREEKEDTKEIYFGPECSCPLVITVELICFSSNNRCWCRKLVSVSVVDSSDEQLHAKKSTHRCSAKPTHFVALNWVKYFVEISKMSGYDNIPRTPILSYMIYRSSLIELLLVNLLDRIRSARV